MPSVLETFSAVYKPKRLEAVLNPSDVLFAKMIDDSLELGRAMMNFEFVDVTPTDMVATLLPAATASGARKSAKPQRASQIMAIAQAPVWHDDPKIILGVGLDLEKKLQNVDIVSCGHIAALTDAEITGLQTHVIKFA